MVKTITEVPPLWRRLGSIDVKNDVREVSLLDAFVREVCSTMQLDEAMATNVCLAVEEAVVNVMKYAYTEVQTHCRR